MPSDTGAPFFVPFNLQGDNPPNLEAITRPIAERVHELLGEIGLGQLVVPGGTGDDGKLVIVKDGAAAYQAMKGDATIAEDGTLAIGVGKVTTAMLVELAVTTAKIANSAVTDSKLANLAVATAKLANEAVVAGKIALGAVTDAKLAANAVTTAKIKDEAVTPEKLAPTSKALFPQLVGVTGAKIARGTFPISVSAAGDSPVVEVAHGLAQVPHVQFTPIVAAGYGGRFDTHLTSRTESHFGCQVFSGALPESVTIQISWLAVG